MDYNTQRKQLQLPEYGRTIQKMVDYCCTLEDKEERTKAANAVIAIMGNMNPHLRDVPDFKHKLWDHLAIMSNFKLDIEWPYPMPDIQLIQEKPEKLDYSDGNIRFRHYGKFIQQIIKKINDYDDPKEKQALLEIMANHMKRSYMVWKKEPIPDEIVFRELAMLTNGELEIPEDLRLNDFKEVLINHHNNNNQKTNKRRSSYKRK
ncbi:MAG: DUF4290 domain-containing protein [Marinilabiliales bacterium]|nr:MAG: DUF4290 domain-containing protein [Marinilabiliales bacterium]